jgi:hypothetical protein
MCCRLLADIDSFFISFSESDVISGEYFVAQMVIRKVEQQ